MFVTQLPRPVSLRWLCKLEVTFESIFLGPNSITITGNSILDKLEKVANIFLGAYLGLIAIYWWEVMSAQIQLEFLLRYTLEELWANFFLVQEPARLTPQWF